MDPLINLEPNIVVDDIGDITFEPSVDPHTITSTNSPQVADWSPLSPKIERPNKLTKGDLDSSHGVKTWSSIHFMIFIKKNVK